MPKNGKNRYNCIAGPNWSYRPQSLLWNGLLQRDFGGKISYLKGLTACPSVLRIEWVVISRVKIIDPAFISFLSIGMAKSLSIYHLPSFSHSGSRMHPNPKQILMPALPFYDISFSSSSSVTIISLNLKAKRWRLKRRLK